MKSNVKRIVLRAAAASSALVLLLTLAGAAGAQSAAHAKIVRPRMLLGERDPLAGLALLRARYNAGARPSDDLAGWALTYLLTGDESFARRAVEEMRRTHPPEKAGSRTYPDYVRWSLAFDWLYNYKGFDDALKDRVALELLKAAEEMLRARRGL